MKKIIGFAAVAALVTVLSTCACAQDDIIVKPGQGNASTKQQLLPGKTFYFACRFQQQLELQDCPFTQDDLQNFLKTALCSRAAKHGLQVQLIGSQTAYRRAASLLHCDPPRQGEDVPDPTYIVPVAILVSQNETKREGSAGLGRVQASGADRKDRLYLTAAPSVITIAGLSTPFGGLDPVSEEITSTTGKQFDVSVSGGRGILRYLNLLSQSTHYREESRGKIPENLQRMLISLADRVVSELVEEINSSGQ